MLRGIIKKVKTLPCWIWFVTIILIVSFSIESYQYLQYDHDTISLLDLLFSQVNAIDMVSIPILIIFLPFYGTGLWVKNRTEYEYRIIKDNKKVDWLKYYFLYFTTIVLLYFSLFYILNIFIFWIEGGVIIDFNNDWSEKLGLSASNAIYLSFLLISFRFIFLSLLAFYIDLSCKKVPFGFISLIFLGLIDGFFYYVFKIDEPLGILPIEHTRIEYTPAWGINNDAFRMSYIYSFIYWIVIIGVLLLLIYIKIRKKTLASIFEKFKVVTHL
jgi:hypothetical protein